MPIVASMGGNAGMQTLAVTIRAIATKELSSSNINKIVVKNFYRCFKWNNFCNYYWLIVQFGLNKLIFQ